MDSKERFSDRVNDYHKHRPTYPVQIISILQKEKALPPDAVVADIGSGTGMLTKLFFAQTKTVYAVEPNEAMRLQAEKDFYDVLNFVSINGSAEATTLPPASLDLITAAQAFHWFDRDKTRFEFKRILKPNGFVALVWNYRDIENDDLQRDYENILRTHIPRYKQLDHKTMTDDKIDNFFGTTDIKRYVLPNTQFFDLPSLKGRLLSSSYVPKPPNGITQRILESVDALFEHFQHNGKIRFVYQTQIYLGPLR